MSSQHSRSVVVGLVQSAVTDDKAANVQRTLDRIREAARRGAHVVCLQELFATPYFCQIEDHAYFELAEEIPGPTTDAISDVARECGITVIASLFERRAAGLYHNSAVIVGPQGQQLGLYRKMHIPDDPQYYEKFYFTPGDLGFIACPTPRAVVGPLVCWDQWYPEAARLTALRGAEMLVYPTAIGWLPADKDTVGRDQVSAWRTIQRSHAIANGVFVIAVNRVGIEHAGAANSGSAGDKSAEASPSIEFWGHSFVVDPFGVVIAEAGESEELLIVECDLRKVEQVRRAWPFLRDRRIDAYSGIERRWLGKDEIK